MEILNSLSSEFCQALLYAALHSLWIGLVILVLCHMINRMGWIKSAEQQFHFYFLNLILLVLSSLICFNSYYEPATGSTSAYFFTQAAEFPVQLPFQQKVAYWFGAIWLVGLLFFTVRLIFGYAYLRGIKAKAKPIGAFWQLKLKYLLSKLEIKEMVNLLISDKTAIPMIIGHFKPVIIVPLSYFTLLSTDEIETILVHELSHVKRHDYLINLFVCLIEGVLFFNPAIWWLSKQIRKHREFACDDLVQKECLYKEKYIEALYKAAQQSTAAHTLSIGLAQKNTDLIMRIKRLLNKPTEKRHLAHSLWKPIFISLLAFCFFAFQSINKEENDEKKKAESIEIAPAKLIEPAIPEVELATPPKLPTLPPSPVEPVEIMNAIPVVPAPSELPELDLIEPKAPVFPINSVPVDTTKKSKKAKKLEKALEKKAKEMEKLAEKLEMELGDNYELKAKEYEEMAAKLESQISLKMKEFEWDNEEFERKMEELSEKLETEIELNIKPLENLEWDSKELEQNIEKLARELEEKYGEHNEKVWNPEDKERFDKLMKEFNDNFNKNFNIHFNENFMNQSNIVDIQNEIAALTEEFNFNSKKMNEMIHYEMKALNEAMEKMDFDFNFNFNDELTDEMNKKAKEMQKLAEELNKELKKDD